MTATTQAAGTLAWRQHIPHTPVSLHSTDTTRERAGRDRVVAVAGAEGGCWLVDIETGHIRAEFALDDGASTVSLSPDGQLVALCGPTAFLIARAEDGAVLHHQPGSWCSDAAWSLTASGRRVAVATGRTVTILDTTGIDEHTVATVVQTTAELPSTVTALCWIRDGRSLLATAYGGVYVFQQHSPHPTRSYPYVGSHLALAVPVGERWICTGNQDRSVHIWRARDGEQLQMSGYPSKISRLAFDDTGRWLAVDGAPDITVWDFAGAGPRGTRPRELAIHAAITALAWQPGSDAVLASYGSEGRLAIWHPAAEQPGRLQRPGALREFGPDAAALRWLTAGSLLVADRSGTITRIDDL